MTGRVLIVDDHPRMAAVIGMLLRADGRFEIVHSASTAEQGLRLIDGDVDVVILDLHLPDGRGFELVQRFASRGVPLVLHSAVEAPDLGDAKGLAVAVVRKGDTPSLLNALAATLA